MRKSVSVAFFSLMSTLLIFGTVIMGSSELVLFSNYFAQERYDVLDEVVNVAQRTASHLVQEAALPEGEELEALNTKLELIGESAEVYLFFTDCDGNVVLASDPDDLAGDVVEASVLEKSAKAKENYHIFGTLDGVLTEKSYISVREMRSESGECTGYLFLCSSGDRLVEFRREFFSNFFLSACLMLLVASVLTKVMMHKLTDPIQKVTDAAQRFGGGDLSVRVEGVDGEGEVADLARTFNQMADNINALIASKKQLIDGIAHELRTPLVRLRYRLEMSDNLSAAESQALNRDISQLEALIEELLTYARLDRPQNELHLSEPDLPLWLSTHLADIQAVTPDKTVRIKTLVQGHYAALDMRLMERVLDNLLNNALRYCHSTVETSLLLSGNRATLIVEDDGPGIAPENREHIFEPFVRLDPSRDRSTGGCGLGLAIVHSIALAMGGTVNCDTSELGGARFSFSWPLWHNIPQFTSA